MKKKTRSSWRKEMPAGTKLYRKSLKSQYGYKGYREHFDVKPIHADKASSLS